MLEGERLHVRLFTDDPKPKALAEKYVRAVNNPNITFSYREHDNAHDANVLEDFFGMAQCDCLIRPESCFSMAAQTIANFKIIIYPKHHVWKAGELVIDKVGVITRPD